jgi:excisionase family DNA binding protein
MAKPMKPKINFGAWDPKPDAEVLSVLQAARMLGIGKAAAYEAVHAGEIPMIRIGNRILVPKTALHAMLDIQAARKAAQ